MRVGLIGIALGLLLPLHSQAEDIRPDLPPPVITRLIVQPGITLDISGVAIREVFRQLDANGDGRLDEADAKMHEALTIAGLKASNAYSVMTSDIDGDGFVTEAEFRARHGYDVRTQDVTPSLADRIEQDLKMLGEADADRDGRISWAEASAVPLYKISSEILALGPPGQVRDVLTFAGRAKGPLDLAQLRSLVAPFLKSVDVDNNGIISSEELAALQQRRREAEAVAERRAREARTACAMPKAAAGGPDDACR